MLAFLSSKKENKTQHCSVYVENPWPSVVKRGQNFDLNEKPSVIEDSPPYHFMMYCLLSKSKNINNLLKSQSLWEEQMFA